MPINLSTTGSSTFTPDAAPVKINNSPNLGAVATPNVNISSTAAKSFPSPISTTSTAPTTTGTPANDNMLAAILAGQKNPVPVKSNTENADPNPPFITPNQYSKAKGMISIPTPGAHVWVMFEGGDPNYPIVLGTIFGKEDYHGIYDMKASTAGSGAPTATAQTANPTPVGDAKNLPAGTNSASDTINGMVGTSTANVPNTDNGNVACAWTVNTALEKATGSPALDINKGGLSVAATTKAIEQQPSRFQAVTMNEAISSGKDYVISSNPQWGAKGSHIGIGKGSTVWSNSSSSRAVKQNYTANKWNSTFGTAKYYIIK